MRQAFAVEVGQFETGDVDHQRPSGMVFMASPE